MIHLPSTPRPLLLRRVIRQVFGNIETDIGNHSFLSVFRLKGLPDVVLKISTLTGLLVRGARGIPG